MRFGKAAWVNKKKYKTCSYTVSKAFRHETFVSQFALRGQRANTFMHEITKSQALQQSQRHLADQGLCLQQAALISLATYDPANRFTQAHADVEVSKVNSASDCTAPSGLT